MNMNEIWVLIRNTLTLGMYDNVVFTIGFHKALKELKKNWIADEAQKIFKYFCVIIMISAVFGSILNTITLGIVKWICWAIGINPSKGLEHGILEWFVTRLYDMSPNWFKEEKRLEAMHIALNCGLRVES